MLVASSALIVEKNKLSNDSPFLVLCEIAFEGDTIRIVKNEENITWDGETWAAFPFEIDDMGEAGRNEIPQMSLSVSNVSRAMQSYVEEYNGGIDANVIIRVVHADNLVGSEAQTVLCRLDCVVTGCYANSKEVTFTLGGPNPWNRRTPLNRARKNFCRWKFKSTECGYSAGETTCNKTLSRCRELSNSSRFGGFPGVGLQGLRIYV